MLRLLYGTGMRLMECLRLRIKEVDFERGLIMVRDGKGGKDRRVMLPEALRGALVEHFARLKVLWEQDRAINADGVWLPDALERKYPNAGKELGWQWVCCSLRALRAPASVTPALCFGASPAG